MIGLIKKLQDKGQAKQDQTDALVEFIQDEMTADAMQKVGQILAPALAPATAPAMSSMQTFAPMSQSDASVLQRLLDEDTAKSQKETNIRQSVPLDLDAMKMQSNPVLNMLSRNKAMDMMNKNQTMNPTILKAKGM